MAKQTAIYEEHVRLGGRMIDFGGWSLPVQYSGLMEEHFACRQSAGLFDVSHMGEVHVEGPDAESFLNDLLTNDVSRVSVGQAQYSVMCQDDGGCVDDLIVYRRAQDKFLVVVNASNDDKDFAWMRSVLARKGYRCTLTHESPNYSQIAIQGPRAAEILQTLTKANLSAVKNYWFIETSICGDIPALLARTGYTGEDGFEIYVAWEKGSQVWSSLLEAGRPLGLSPCGLGARDTLRLEMKYPLYGHEISETINPLEAGLGWAVKLTKPGGFIGSDALKAMKEKGLSRSLVGLRMLDRGIPRQDYEVFDALGKERLGVIASGTQSPTLKMGIATALIPIRFTTTGTQITVDIRGAKVPAEVISTPFYKRS
ncbi:MAG: glycine cleavage system aminomethyltransferase GcvT [Bdellovibrionales bacterium]|nr:glycine cleavage system aminomethyltransferase GcvT [Bdellovibrionales bacterium]